jgi:uncharacterized protein YdhG (YjbR/CyaY superfamily)
MSTAESVAAYLESVPATARPTLDALVDAVRSATPGAAETISYGVPTFVLDKPVVAVSASAKHCGLHLMSPSLMASLKDEIDGYKTTASTVQFPLTGSVPVALVTKLVTARVAENESRAAGYAKKEANSV